MITRPIWLEGELVAPSRATIPVLSHAAHRGALAFDFGVFHATHAGPAVFRLRDHVARFRRSASQLGYELGFDAAALEAATRAVVAASTLSDGHVRWSAFVPSPEPDLVPRSSRASVAIAAYAPGDLADDGPPLAAKPTALRIAVFDDARKAPPEVFPPLAKIAGAYVGPMIAKRRAIAAGAHEVVLLDGDGNVAEAPTSNVFAVSGGTLVTPPLGRILDGITRDSVLAIARAEGIPAEETVLGRHALEAADEAFLAASSFPIAPIISVNGHAMKAGAPGPLTKRLQELLHAAERGRDPRFEAWVG